MKKFMSKISALCLTVLAGTMFTGCSNSEEVAPQTQPQTGRFTLTVVAEKQGGTRALAIGDANNDGNADVVATWTAGDEVRVYDATTGTALTGVLTAENSGASTRLTGTVEGTLSEGDELRLSYLSNDYSGQDGTLQYIAQHCDYAEATVTVGKVEAGVITPTGTASFVNAQAIAKFTLTEVTGAGINAESLTVGYGTESLSLTIPAATYATNGDGVLYVALPPFLQQTVSLTATVGDDTYTYTTTGTVSLEAGQFQPIGVMMEKDLSGEINGRAYVDLGLPSGTLWATCNIGADSPEDYGLYFAWGETTGYTGDTNDGRFFDWASYIYSVNAYTTLTKYCNDSSYGYEGFTDNLTELELGDDAAYVNWGSDWRMPSDEQFQELVNSDYTTTEWVAVNGVYGRLITSKMAGHTHKSIFMPAAGYRYESTLTLAGSGGSYYSRTLNTSEPYSARGIYLNENNINAHYGNRYRARSIRPVRASQNSHEYVDLGLPSGTLWATCNVGADSPEDYGDYFAWGETEPYSPNGKTEFTWSTYKYCNGLENTLTKYCNNSDFGYNGFTDNLTELTTSDDAAYVNWGGDWRMPTIEQFDELINNNYTNTEWTMQNGVYGRKVTSKMSGYTNRSIFLPAAGCRYHSSFDDAGSYGDYWSRTLDTSNPNYARKLYFYSDDIGTNYEYIRYDGRSVRPVRASQ